MSPTSPGASPTSLPPAILAQRYRLERKLAQGGMAEVWLGTDLSLTRQVAVKLLKPTLAADPVVAERFRREAIAVAQLSHPNIVAVYDAVDDTIGGEKRQAVVMQLVNGKSLRQLLDEQKRLSPDLTMHIGACMASALDYAHQANLVHRDIKPGNILITPDGRVLLTDFGIAKGLGSSDEDLTSPNVMMGTAKYLSPEQVRGRKLDGRADLYSLGLVLYECLAGRVPFLGRDRCRHRAGTPQPRPNRPHPAAPDAALRAGAADPQAAVQQARRPYATGAEVRNELQRIAGQPRNDLTGDVTRDGTRGTPPRGSRPRQPPGSAPTQRTHWVHTHRAQQHRPRRTAQRTGHQHSQPHTGQRLPARAPWPRRRRARARRQDTASHRAPASATQPQVRAEEHPLDDGGRWPRCSSPSSWVSCSGSR